MRISLSVTELEDPDEGFLAPSEITRVVLTGVSNFITHNFIFFFPFFFLGGGGGGCGDGMTSFWHHTQESSAGSSYFCYSGLVLQFARRPFQNNKSLSFAVPTECVLAQ